MKIIISNLTKYTVPNRIEVRKEMTKKDIKLLSKLIEDYLNNEIGDEFLFKTSTALDSFKISYNG
jgi:phosphopantothenate synthetase